MRMTGRRRAMTWTRVMLAFNALLLLALLLLAPLLLAPLVLVATVAADVMDAPPPSPTPRINVTVLAAYPHNSSSFTEGLMFGPLGLYESVGLEGRSDIRLVDLETGNALLQHALDPSLYAEGITALNDRIYQLTYTSGQGFVYDDELHTIGAFNFTPEGWGLTTDETFLIRSDGTCTLYFHDPETMAVNHTVCVTDANSAGARVPVVNVNELEYIRGYVWTNIWTKLTIAVIDPSTGYVVLWLDLTELQRKARNPSGASFPNGIAYNVTSSQLYVTGKLWSLLFEIELPEVPPPPSPPPLPPPPPPPLAFVQQQRR